MKLLRIFSRTLNLRQAAATIFALTAILPLLVVLVVLLRSRLHERAELQLGLLLATVIALLGFFLLRQTVGRISMLARAVRGWTVGERTPVRHAEMATLAGLGSLNEIRQIGEAFGSLLEELRVSSGQLETLVFKLGTLSEMVELAARIPKMQDLLALTLERARRAVRATAGSIMLLDQDRQTLWTAAALGLGKDVLATVEVRLGEAIAGSVAQRAEPVVVDDMERDSRFGDAEKIQYGGGAFICMPVQAGNRVVGVVNVARGREGGASAPQPFSAADLQFLTALMTYVGYALENARLLEETQQSAERLQELLEDLKAAQTQLVQGETLRAIGQLASGMAHHLNNILTVIVARIQLLRNKVSNPEISGVLQAVERAGLKGAEVVRGIQVFSRSRGGVSEPIPLDLNRLAQEVLEVTRPLWEVEAQLRGVQISTSLEAGQVPTVTGDPVSLREALMNLILNAIDALPNGGTIMVKTWTSEGWVHCSVGDNGVGMSEAVRRRALEPFFTTKGPQRTGLGLSVAYGILQPYGGELVIESDEGRGTTVTLSLPVGSATSAPPGGAPGPTGSRPALRILVVDDEPEVLATLAEVLAAQGHVVVEAAGAGEAVAFLEAGETVDLVLTDLVMPGMTGWEVARAVKARWPDLPVGLITGWGEGREDAEVAAEKRSAVDFVIAKPIVVPALLREIARVFAQPRGRSSELRQPGQVISDESVAE